MGRKIILLSDGTGNSSAKVWRTNVWRTFEALDLSGSDQVAFYDDGVGTSSFKPMAVLGGAFGLGLRRNVIALYKFACRNYHDDQDELYGFGFSRGAFTIRIVMGLIDSQGLVKADSEAELRQLWRSAAYRAYRRDRYHHPEAGSALPVDPQPVPSALSAEGCPHQGVRIRFVGVWDTVAAYGMPIDEMTRGIHQYLWPIELPEQPSVRRASMRACQALSLDEERTTFHPQLWDETKPAPAPINTPTRPIPQGRHFLKNELISQVWFAGVHTNVGGGYPDDSLAYIPFVWMINEARRCGLKFKSDYADQPNNHDVMRADPDTFKNAISKRDKDGRLYDPRKGFGGYYRYGPRKLVPHFYRESHKLEEDEVEVERAKIHESVFRRIDNHAQAYAPVGLPPYYDVVKEDGEIISPDKFRVAPDRPPFETLEAAGKRAEAQEYVWNWVWGRRIAYFATVGATLWLVLFPLLSSAQRADEYYSRLRWVSDLVRFIGGFLPKFALTWIDGYARAPFQFVVMVAVLGALLWASSTIASRTSNLMSAIWRKTPGAPSGLPESFVYGLRSNRVYIAFHEGLKRNIAPAFFAALFVYLGLSALSHASYNVLDVWGETCIDNKSDSKIPPSTRMAVGETRLIRFDTSDLCKATGVDLETNGARYYFRIDETTPWANGKLRIPIGGFSTQNTDAASWYERIYLTLFLPLRRELFEDWFRIVLRYGSRGGEEIVQEPDLTDPLIQNNIRPTREGQLYVFVNDAVIGIPGLYGWLYKDNKGTAELTIKRTK